MGSLTTNLGHLRAVDVRVCLYGKVDSQKKTKKTKRSSRVPTKTPPPQDPRLLRRSPPLKFTSQILVQNFRKGRLLSKATLLCIRIICLNYFVMRVPQTTKKDRFARSWRPFQALSTRASPRCSLQAHMQTTFLALATMTALATTIMMQGQISRSILARLLLRHIRPAAFLLAPLSSRSPT